jgi:uncharacterized membrane protein
MRDTMLIIHFIGLVMGVGTGFAHAFLGSAAAKMSPEEATKFRLKTLVISGMGNTGLTLLVISGLYLIIPFWEILPTASILIAKLVLVLVLIVLIILVNMSARRALKGNPEVEFEKLQLLGKITLVVSLSIIITAVLQFH